VRGEGRLQVGLWSVLCSWVCQPQPRALRLLCAHTIALTTALRGEEELPPGHLRKIAGTTERHHRGILHVHGRVPPRQMWVFYGDFWCYFILSQACFNEQPAHHFCSQTPPTNIWFSYCRLLPCASMTGNPRIVVAKAYLSRFIYGEHN
jgi:hypothetical protein